MTLHEIEETLHELQSRHPGLSEALLVTLLRSGGWEEKNIQEALFLFRSGGAEPGKDASATNVADALPVVETESVLPPPVDEKHLLMEHNDETPSHIEVQTAPPEPQSFVNNLTESIPNKKDELPHNLPLRPFETSEHIWPFARYRDVFYGEAVPKAEVKEEKKIEVAQETVVTKEEMKMEPHAAVPSVEAHTDPEPVMVQEKETTFAPLPVHDTPTPIAPAAKGDGNLVVMACIMLLVILLLLGYMYSNGRL